MRTMLILLGASALATPAFAQHSGHAAARPARQQPPPAADPSCPPEHAAMGHCTPKQTAPAPPEPQAQRAPAAAPSCPPEHAAMGHCTPGAEATSDHEPGIPDPPVAAPSAAALRGPRNAADQVYGAAEMAGARDLLRQEHGDIITSKLMIDQLEVGFRKGRQSYAWQAQAWYGGDIDRLWIKSEGGGTFGERPEKVEAQALYSRAIDPWFNLQGGVRQDLAGGLDRTHLALGIQGLAPYWFEVDGALFLSTKGDLTGRFAAEYDQRLTQKLILQPNAELDLAAQDVPEIGIGAGLSSAELGLRLRYAFVPEFAPYIGVQYERLFGRTRDQARARGDDAGGFSFVVGLRTWF